MAHGIDLIESESQLIELMTRPSPPVVEAVGALDGDILILGVGGKMGPTLAELMVRAGCTGEVIGVARFSDRAVENYLQGAVLFGRTSWKREVWQSCRMRRMSSFWPVSSSVPRATKP